MDQRAALPAYAKAVISVGSWVSRNGWRTVDGRDVGRGSVVGRPSAFSGTGPALDGRFVPDLVAPGEVWGERVNEVDLRVAKVLRFGRENISI